MVKKKPPRGGFFCDGVLVLALLDVRGLLALGSLDDVETHLLAFLQALESLHVDRREMREQVLAAVIRRNEAVALRVVEPLYGADSHLNIPLPSGHLAAFTRLQQPRQVARAASFAGQPRAELRVSRSNQFALAVGID